MENYQNQYMGMPGMSIEEMTILQQTTAGLTVDQRQQFNMLYGGKRKSPQDILMFCVIGIVIPGMQRFVIGQTGMGFLFFFTGGLFFVMTVMDLLNHKKLALDFNTKMAYESIQMVTMSFNKIM